MVYITCSYLHPYMTSDMQAEQDFAASRVVICTEFPVASRSPHLSSLRKIMELSDKKCWGVCITLALSLWGGGREDIHEHIIYGVMVHILYSTGTRMRRSRLWKRGKWIVTLQSSFFFLLNQHVEKKCLRVVLMVLWSCSHDGGVAVRRSRFWGEGKLIDVLFSFLFFPY